LHHRGKSVNKTPLLILGGYGTTGSLLAGLLLKETDLRLVLAGRNIQKAEVAAVELNRTCQEERVAGACADASDAASLKRVFQGVDMVVVASSTAKYAKEVAAAALETGIDYLDIQYSTQKVGVLKSMQDEIEAAGRCFITDGGFHPGLPAALVRYAAQHFDSLEKAVVGSVIKEDWRRLSVADDTLVELLEEINDFVPLIYKAGRWKKAGMYGMQDALTMDFGREFGKQYCVPMFLEEMRPLPESIPSLKETGFYVGGFNWFVDWLVLPLAAIGIKLWPRTALKPMGRLLRWSLNTFSKPPYGTMLKAEARGARDGRAKAMDITLYHEDGYVFTAIPVAACLLQYLDGSMKKPGLWTQANIVEPDRLIRDMERMGIEVKIQMTQIGD
jgi:saccharopine dehydrogenase-like NADP-dependent oxidoreductase